MADPQPFSGRFQRQRTAAEADPSPLVDRRQGPLPPPVVPRGFLCPLTSRVMSEPVVLVGSGRSFERQALEQHLAAFRDPATGLSLRPAMWVPNLALRCVIEEWLSTHGLDHEGADRLLLAATGGQQCSSQDDSTVAQGGAAAFPAAAGTPLSGAASPEPDSGQGAAVFGRGRESEEEEEEVEKEQEKQEERQQQQQQQQQEEEESRVASGQSSVHEAYGSEARSESSDDDERWWWQQQQQSEDDESLHGTTDYDYEHGWEGTLGYYQQRVPQAQQQVEMEDSDEGLVEQQGPGHDSYYYGGKLVFREQREERVEAKGRRAHVGKGGGFEGHVPRRRGGGGRRRWQD